MDHETNKTQIIFRQVLINTLSNYGGKIVTLGIWFFLTPFILNRLGQSDLRDVDHGRVVGLLWFFA